MKELQPHEVDRQSAQNFLKRINKPGTPKEVKVNEFANNSKYIPISHIEMRLDEYFFGFWQTVNFRSQVVVNEIIGSIDLQVKHPVTGEWLTRTGSASVPIQMHKGSGVLAVEEKIHNTLVKDYPHLKTMCILNAAKSLGKLFGRDLNREFEDEYQPLLKLPEDDPATNNQLAYIESLLHTCTLDEPQKRDIEMKFNKFTSLQAGAVINNLLLNQEKSLDEQFKQITQ